MVGRVLSYPEHSSKALRVTHRTRRSRNDADALVGATERALGARLVLDTGVASVDLVDVVWILVELPLAVGGTFVDVVVLIETLGVLLADLWTLDLTFDLVGSLATSERGKNE
jgi:hypothetical protein